MKYVVLHGEMALRNSIDNLRLAISDQNLELLPDYEQRIAVLQELKFIDVNSTVQLKGRVACEVSEAPWCDVYFLLLLGGNGNCTIDGNDNRA